jgi:hypothetical protein
MENDITIGDPVPQCMVRPLDFLPEARKQMMRTMDLQIAEKGDIDALRELLARHPERLNLRGSHNRTLLWEAVRRSRLPAAAWLIEQGADVNAPGRYNNDARRRAASITRG